MKMIQNTVRQCARITIAEYINYTKKAKNSI